MREKESVILEAKYLAGNKSSLLKGLQSLQEYISALDQSYDASRLDKVATGLVQGTILRHSTKEVRVIAACCLADILHVYAPNAPYDDDELRRIFSLFISVLQDGLEDPDDPTFQRYYYLLERLATVKAFNLLLDLEDADLLVELFSGFFNIVNDSNAIIWSHITDIICSCIEDMDEMILKVLEVLLTPLISCPSPFLLPKIEGTDVDEGKSPAYQLAAGVLKKLADRLRPHISCFLKLILQYDTTHESLSASEIPENLNHIIWELFVIEKTLLVPVLPDFGSKLDVDDLYKRTEAVHVLISIFAFPGIHHNTPATAYRSLFTNFLTRFNDKEPSIRILMVKFGLLILKNYPDVASSCSIEDSLTQRVLDNDDKVRETVVHQVCDFLKKNPEAVPSMKLSPLISQISSRLRDKKIEVRRETFYQLARLFSSFVDHWGPSWSPPQIKQLGGIPSAILKCYFQPPFDFKYLVDEVMDDIIFPAAAPLSRRVDILIHNVLPLLDENAMNGLLSLIRDKVSFRNAFATFLTQPSLANKPALERVLNRGLGNISGTSFVDQVSNLFGKKSNSKSLDQFKKLCHFNSKYSDLRKAKGDIKSAAAMPGLAKEAKKLRKVLGQRLSLTLFCEETVLACLKELKQLGGEDEENEKASVVFDLLESLSEVPDLFTSAGNFLCQNFQTNPEVFLHILSFLKKPALKLPSTFKDSLSRYCVEGSAKEAKYSVRVIKNVFPPKQSAAIFQTVLSEIGETIKTANSTPSSRKLEDDPGAWADLLPGIVTMGEIARSDLVTFHPLSKTVIQFIEKAILTSKFVQHLEESLGCELQRQSVKLIAKYAEACALDETRESYALPLVSLLHKILAEDKGIFLPDSFEAKKSCISGLLKLACTKKHDVLFSEDDFFKLAFLILEEYDISSYFLKTLHVYLSRCRLPLRYLSILCLGAANSKDKRVSTESHHCLSAAVSRRRQYFREMMVKLKEQNAAERKRLEETAKKGGSAAKEAKKKLQDSKLLDPANDPDIICHYLPEYTVPYVLHLIAHSPVFSREDSKSRKESTACLELFFNEIFVGENNKFPFVVHILELLKTRTEDSLQPGKSGRLPICILSDIALAIVNEKSKKRHWTDKRTSLPLEFRLPTRLFVTVEEPFDSIGKSYLPSHFNLPDHSARTKMLVSDASPRVKADLAASSKVDESPPSENRKRSLTFGDKGKPAKRARKSERSFEEEMEESDQDDEWDPSVIIKTSLSKKGEAEKQTSPAKSKSKSTPKGKQTKSKSPQKGKRARKTEEAMESDESESEEEFAPPAKRTRSAAPPSTGKTKGKPSPQKTGVETRKKRVNPRRG